MPRVAAPTPPRRPSGPPPRRPAGPATLGEPRNMKDRPQGWKLALRRQRRRVRPVLYGTAALVLLASIGLVAQASSHAASLTGLRQRFGDFGALFGLRVENVVVLPATATTPKPLLDAAIGVAKGDPLLGYSVSGARERLTSLASVQDATVERRWPGTILVNLVERHPFAVWQNQGKFVLIDSDGSTLADQDVRLAPQLPLVVGLGAPPHAKELLDEIDAHGEIASHLVAAVRVGDRRWNLRMTSGADVLLPEDDQASALDRLAMLQQTHQLLDRKLQIIDLRLADRTTLRPDNVPVAPAATTPAPDTPPPVEGPLTPTSTARRPT